MLERHIQNEQQLSELCEQLAQSPWLALDTEFVREKTYYPQFCLLQISNGDIAASVDPIQIKELQPLLDLLYDENIVKVFHAGRQDLEIFHHLWGRLPTPLFDTQLAASLLGLGDQVGYGNLVEKLLNQSLEKGHTRTDWSRRPLDEAQLRYALDDVIYLGELYLTLKQRLQAEGREGWLRDDFDQLANPDTYSNPPQEAWKRIKGRQQLKGVQLAVLQALAAWREREAQQANRPKRWILKDEVLADLARRQPKALDQLEKIRGLEPGAIKRRGELLLKLIADARALPREQWPRDKRRAVRLTPNQEALTDMLYGCLRLLAEQNNITPAALAGRKEIEALVSGERELEILHGWRRVIAGNRLLQVLDGKYWPELDDGQVILSERSPDA
ncbi:ribonuclease D [Sedimenticola selenatireducens]|uniref:ribonuclease D n=1 Tax=Sedimenticola selenatireducens TaxID=191960 RepID=UPI00049166EC|nr:ribonuclease D [Sedimenticola selenatireducens]